MDYEIVDSRLKLPSSLTICGSSGSGKTELVFSLLDPSRIEAVFGEQIQNIYWIYSIYQPAYDKLKAINPQVKFVQSFSQVPKDLKGKTVLVWDDQMLTFQSNRKAKKDILDVFFRLAHHKNYFNIVILQTLHGHGLRSAILNSQYMVIFPIKSDVSQIRHCSMQMFPNVSSSFLIEALLDSGKERWGYLLLDRSPNQDPRFCVRNFVYPKPNGKFYFPVDKDGSGRKASRISSKSRKIKKARRSKAAKRLFRRRV